MVTEPRHQVDLSDCSVSQCHLAPVSLDHYSANGIGPWYRCHECNQSCAIRKIPADGYQWCERCNHKGYYVVKNPLKLVNYDQTQLDRSGLPAKLVEARKSKKVKQQDAPTNQA